MSITSFFRSRRKDKQSAETARDRLQIVLAHERMSVNGDDFLPRLQREIMAVVVRYVDIDPSQAVVKLEKDGDLSTLEIEVTLPKADSLGVQRVAS
ncbi:MAG: cell division topological specificity factor MinE [Rhodospirillales bacterium]|nr:cell division topological specificity factor MinE [Rhodospirillales bacterium]